MNKILITLGITAVSGLISVSTHAAPKRHTDVARVTHVQPIYQTVEHRVPRESCWTETVREEQPSHRQRSGTPALIGGIIGGVIGNEVGRGGDNKKIGAVVGSILGMSVAKDIQKKHRQESNGYDVSYRDVERCETSYDIETEQIVDGYNVNYRYQGRDYTTFMNEHPGKKIRVAVNVRPITH